jgi:hypothetical protein
VELEMRKWEMMRFVEAGNDEKQKKGITQLKLKSQKGK